MKHRTLRNILLVLLLSCTFPFKVFAQSPGTIVAPMNGNGVTILNPNGDRFSSKTTSGFTTNDITESEVAFKVVPPMLSEGAADNSNGAVGGFTDIISAVDGSGFYAFFDGTNILFRLRMGGTNNGAKAYSVLLDTDMKFGNTGQYADPNFVASGVGTTAGNPGFEYEVVFSSQFDVTVYNIDGKTAGTVVGVYPLKTNSQISVALSRTSGDADFFYDWGVPAATIGSPALIRFVASAQISPHPALRGNVSDVFGINDNNFSSLADAWTQIINAQCGFPLGALGGTSPLCATCTKPPIINPITTTGNNLPVTGNWTSLDPSKPNTATISLYRNGTFVGSTTATSGAAWSIIVSTVYSNDVFTAKAKATDESECLFSPPIIGGCTTPPAAPAITCASRKGIQGTIPLGAEAIIFLVSGTSRTLMTTELVYTDNATNRTFDYHGTVGQTGSACQGNVNDVLNGTYEIMANLNGCYSQPIVICISGNDYSPIAGNAITLNTPILNRDTSVTGSGATAGQVLRLYRNGFLLSTLTAAGATFTFNGLTLFQNDQLRVTSIGTAAGSCMTASNAFTVTCFTTQPAINANAQGEVLSSSSSISGTALDAGATIKLYKGLPSASTLVATTTVGANKNWAVGGLTLVPGDTYCATCTMLCESIASKIVVVRGPTTVCPTITGTYDEKSTVVSGTMPAPFTGKIRLYLDGAAIDSVSITNADTWSIAVNTSGLNKLYAYGILKATAEGINLAEGPVCSVVQVQCLQPVAPVVTPASATIFNGQSASFTITNAVDTLLYSIWDTYGNNYASSKFGSGSNTLVVPSYAFTAAGTYDLQVVADKLTGSPCYSSTPITVMVQNVVLATRFVHLSAVSQGAQVNITWRVANEAGVRQYKVERSLDGVVYKVIAVAPLQPSALTTNEYAVVDNSVPAAKVFYRIQLVSNNGAAVYSDVMVASNETVTRLQLSPNPANGGTKLSFVSRSSQLATIELFDLSGKSQFVRKMQVNRGANVIPLTELTRYTAGTYLLCLTFSEGKQYAKLILW